MSIIHSILVIYALSSLFVIFFMFISLGMNNEEINDVPPDEWVWNIFTPCMNTVISLIIIWSMIKGAWLIWVRPVFYSTWQILPNVQYRDEPSENCYFIVISFPIYGSIVCRFERKVKETDGSHHTE